MIQLVIKSWYFDAGSGPEIIPNGVALAKIGEFSTMGQMLKKPTPAWI